jgi:hypothetical protein
MSDAVGPVFVAGCPRSGTTALSWAIAAHPGYHTSAETHFFYYLLRETDDNSLERVFSQSSGGGSWLKKFEVDFEQFLFYTGVGLDRMMRDKTGGQQWVDGSPENVIVGQRLLAMFPGAHMFVAMRDPRSVCLSMLNSGFAPAWARDLDAAIREWRYYARAALELAAFCPDRVLIVKQEDMRHRSAEIVAAIAERLRLGNPEAVSRFLSTTTINSSFDKKTYADDSPFRSQHAVPFPREEFMSRHGEYIMQATSELAGQFGYVAAGGVPLHNAAAGATA